MFLYLYVFNVLIALIYVPFIDMHACVCCIIFCHWFRDIVVLDFYCCLHITFYICCCVFLLQSVFLELLYYIISCPIADV